MSGRACYDAPEAWASTRAELVEALLARFGSGGTLLDVGCGRGRAWRGFRVLGIDALPDAVSEARDRGIEAVQGDACSLPSGSATTDAVLLLDVLEHVGDDARAVAEAWRVLRAGGVLVVSVPLYPRLWSRHDEEMGHLRRYRPGEASRLLETSGFKTVYRTSWNSLGLAGAVFRKAGFGIEKAVPLAQPFLSVESWLAARVPLAMGLSEVTVGVKTGAETLVGASIA